MEEKKLTDEEILQGLECCRKGCRDKSCFGVEMDGIATCTNILTQNALDLIHRLQSEKAEYEQKLDDGELVSKDWHDEQVLHLQEENDRLNDMKFTQEHCDLYKENEWLKAELKRELAEHEEFTQKAKADIESLKCNSYKTSWKAKFLEAKAEVERLTEENAILKENPPILVGRSLGKTIRAKLLAFDKMKEQNAELQKQVEAWKARAKELEQAWETSSSNEEKLQKQVDELKELNAKYLDSIESVQAGRCRFRCELTQQAVKDTAKEILTELLHARFETECTVSNYKKSKEDIEIVATAILTGINEKIKEIAKRKGVEVE